MVVTHSTPSYPIERKVENTPVYSHTVSERGLAAAKMFFIPRLKLIYDLRRGRVRDRNSCKAHVIFDLPVAVKRMMITGRPTTARRVLKPKMMEKPVNLSFDQPILILNLVCTQGNVEKQG